MGKAEEIILHVQRIEDIFFRSAIPLSCKRLLNRDTEEFVIEEAESLSVKNNIVLSVNFEERTLIQETEITALVHKHFAYCKGRSEKQLKNILRLGWRALLVGFAFLIIMFLLTKALVALVPEGGLVLTLKELFIILGWVALWRPAELLLYEWRPHKRKAKLFERLSECKVQFLQKNSLCT